MKCGNPGIEEVGAQWNPETSKDGWFGSPDNCTIDRSGRLWVSNDQGHNWAKISKADGLYSVETESELRGTSKLFFACRLLQNSVGLFFVTTKKLCSLLCKTRPQIGRKTSKDLRNRQPLNIRRPAGQTSKKASLLVHQYWL